MHRHFCEIDGYDWQCSDDCECNCGLAMEGDDHSDCPMELRPCPMHAAEHGAQLLEATFNADTTPEMTDVEPRRSVPHCTCGCAEVDAAEIIGWCLWCNHVYSNWSFVIQDRHFARHCSVTPMN